jgi:hypothetical protein
LASAKRYLYHTFDEFVHPDDKEIFINGKDLEREKYIQI